MSVKIVDNSRQVILDNTVKVNLWLRFMADEVVKASTPVTPKKAGNLRRDIVKSVVGLTASIRWGKSYAQVQQFVQHQNYTTPGTGPHFVEAGVKGAVSKIPEIARKVGLI